MKGHSARGQDVTRKVVSGRRENDATMARVAAAGAAISRKVPIISQTSRVRLPGVV